MRGKARGFKLHVAYGIQILLLQVCSVFYRIYLFGLTQQLKTTTTRTLLDGTLTVTPDSNTQTNVNSGPVTTMTIPYIRGTSETIARVLQPYNIRVTHKPTTTLRRLRTNVKDKDKPEDSQGAVYKCYSTSFQML